MVQFSKPSHRCSLKGDSVCRIVLKMCTWQKRRLAHQKGEGSCRWWRCMSSSCGTYTSQGSELQRQRRKMRWGKTGEGRKVQKTCLYESPKKETPAYIRDFHRWGWSIILIDEKTTLMVFVLFGRVWLSAQMRWSQIKSKTVWLKRWKSKNKDANWKLKWTYTRFWWSWTGCEHKDCW